MVFLRDMNKPKVFESAGFKALLDCGPWHNRWLRTALEYLPRDLPTKKNEELYFTSTATRRDACRVARDYCQTRELILISERILPGMNISCETDPKARYFIYVVLHEVAHAIKKHHSPLLDDLTREELEAQEKEADELAMKWFNEHVVALKREDILLITEEEIRQAQEKNQVAMKTLMKGA